MSLLGSAALFEDPTGLYWTPAEGTGYTRYAFFGMRLDSLKQRFAPNGQKLLVAGCGWGFLVDELLTAGYDAWGCDASAYCVGKAPQVLPAASAARVRQADVLVAAQLDAMARAAGLRGNPPRWDLLVTEDLLEMLTDAEIPTALALLRARCRANLGHIVTPFDPWEGANCDPRVNWKTYDQWRAIVSPPDVLIGQNGEVV